MLGTQFTRDLTGVVLLAAPVVYTLDTLSDKLDLLGKSLASDSDALLMHGYKGTALLYNCRTQMPWHVCVDCPAIIVIR